MEQCPYLTLWSDGNAFVCIEPCWGLPDHQEQRPFENKLGIQIVPPRGTLEAGCAFEALLL
jgi:galactose mutarotase-like enzyme